MGMSIERLPTLRRLLHTTPDEVLPGADTGGESWLHAQLTRAGDRRPLPRIPERGPRRAGGAPAVRARKSSSEGAGAARLSPLPFLVPAVYNDSQNLPFA